MSDSPTEFAERIRQRFPEGLTGLFALGGTRTTYLIAHRREASDPGHIPVFEDYVSYGFALTKDLIATFFELGGQNLVITPLSYQLLSGRERGEKYAAATAELTLKLMDSDWIDFYRLYNADPYFVGIDTLLQLPEGNYAHDLGVACQKFNESWQYGEKRRKLIWEIAPIPLFSFWNAPRVMGESAQAELDAALASATDLHAIHDLVYKYYARAVFGTDLPIPHFYLGTNRSGDLKLRSVLPIALLCGGPFRLYYTPYPSLMVVRETLVTILEDLLTGKPVRSTQFDYSGQITPEQIEAEYQRVLELSADPTSTVGLARISAGDGDEA